MRDLNTIYNQRKAETQRNILDSYNILGFLSSGTYGKVFKATARDDADQIYAIKKFKPDRDGEYSFTGISQSAIREIALNREIDNDNLAKLIEVLLVDGAIYMVFDYAEHDLLQIIYHHSQSLRQELQPIVVKSILHQLINGVHYLHSNYIMHRDLKPANILITNKGVVKVGDLGLARVYRQPLQPLYNGDKVVVTIWYRAPELLLGARHYTPSVDVWAIGCIYAEMLSLRPMFKGEEARIDGKKLPFQRHQMMCIMDVLGYPNTQNWPGIKHMPEYSELQPPQTRFSYKLPNWFNQRSHSIKGFNLLHSMLTYDPEKRITAREALTHPFFVSEEPAPVKEPFVVYNQVSYPTRRLTQDDELTSNQNTNQTDTSARGSGPGGALNPRKRTRLL